MLRGVGQGPRFLCQTAAVTVRGPWLPSPTAAGTITYPTCEDRVAGGNCRMSAGHKAAAREQYSCSCSSRHGPRHFGRRQASTAVISRAGRPLQCCACESVRRCHMLWRADVRQRSDRILGPGTIRQSGAAERTTGGRLFVRSPTTNANRRKGQKMPVRESSATELRSHA